MSGGPERIATYLAHVLQAIERIGRYTDDMNEVAFFHDEMAQDAVIRNFEIIGEACRNIERADPTYAALPAGNSATIAHTGAASPVATHPSPPATPSQGECAASACPAREKGIAAPHSPLLAKLVRKPASYAGEGLA